MTDQEIKRGTVARLRKTRIRDRGDDNDLLYIEGLKRYSFRKTYSAGLRYSKSLRRVNTGVYDPLLADERFK